HGPIRWTGGPQPHIPYSRYLRALTPGPIAELLQVVAFDLPPIRQIEDIGTLPFYEERALVSGSHMAHELRIAKPAISHDHRRRHFHTASAECHHASIQHALDPAQFVAARCPRAWGVGPTDGKVDGDDQLALTDHYDQQHPVNAREHPVFLAAPPGTHQ